MKGSVNVITPQEASGNLGVTELKHFSSLLFLDEHSFHMFNNATDNINTETNILQIHKTLSCSHIHLIIYEKHQLVFQMWVPKFSFSHLLSNKVGRLPFPSLSLAPQAKLT